MLSPSFNFPVSGEDGEDLLYLFSQKHKVEFYLVLNMSEKLMPHIQKCLRVC